MPTTTQIDGYEVLYSSNSFSRRIGLKKGSSYIGQLVFLPNGGSLPVDGLNGGQPQLHYHLEDFCNCLDLLRNESPLYLYYSGSGGGNENGIKTAAESVGEGE